MRKTDSTEKLTTLIKAATSPFHTAAAIVKELRIAGFEPLVMNRPWQLEARIFQIKRIRLHLL